MKTIHARSHVGPGGELSINLTASELANRDVDILLVIQPVHVNGHTQTKPGFGVAEPWSEFVKRIVGGWQGDELQRPDQGDFEVRESFE